MLGATYNAQKNASIIYLSLTLTGMCTRSRTSDVPVGINAMPGVEGLDTQSVCLANLGVDCEGSGARNLDRHVGLDIL